MQEEHQCLFFQSSYGRCKAVCPKFTLATILLTIPMCCWLTLHRLLNDKAELASFRSNTRVHLLPGYIGTVSYHTQPAPGLSRTLQFPFLSVGCKQCQSYFILFLSTTFILQERLFEAPKPGFFLHTVSIKKEPGKLRLKSCTCCIRYESTALD